MRKIRKRRKRNVLISVVSLLIVFAMAFGMLQSSNTVYAAEPKSDASTATSYTESLGNGTSTQYAGRVWTDKTVYTEDATFTGDIGNEQGSAKVEIGDSKFLVAYSALAQSQQITGQAQVPIDTVFVIDISGSMANEDSGMDNGQSRISNLVDALNESIDTLMSMNPQNRIAVVAYSSGTTTLLPLDHYTKIDSRTEYFSLDRTRPNNNNQNDPTQLYTRALAGNNYIRKTTDVSGGTNIHMGVDAGMDILKNEADTSVEIDGEQVNRVPSLILLSDGAPTYSGADSQGWNNNYVSWWDPSGSEGTGYSAGQGNRYDQGDAAYEKFAMKTIMNAAYNKQQVSEHYGVTGTNYQMKVYTVGVGLSDLTDSTDRNTANLTLNPREHLTDYNTISNAVRTQWNHYQNHQQATLDGYTFRHPTSGDDITSVAYNDSYYSAENASDVTEVFEDIVSDISISAPQVPTKVSGDDPVHDGYITYTDYIGEYMQVSDVKEILYGGQVFTQKTSSTDGNTTTYTFSGDINSPVYGTHNVNEIVITVEQTDDTHQVLTVKIPASAIPIRVTTINLDSNGAVKESTSNDAYPIRVFYTIDPQKGINLDTLEGVSEDYIATHSSDGKVNFYSNLYTGQKQGDTTVGNATVSFTPANDNPFYYLQENIPLYLDADCSIPARNYDENETYYFKISYYDGTSLKQALISRSGDLLKGYTGSINGQLNLKKDAPRLGNLEDFVKTKSDGNNQSNTAKASYYPTWNAEEQQFVVYLGNNGILQAEIPASLTIEKKVTAGTGLTAPDKEFTFNVTVEDFADSTVNAVLHTPNAQDEEQQLAFDENGTASFKLKADQSLEIPDIQNHSYAVEEVNVPDGFTSAVPDNARGTAGTSDITVTFTNSYNVEVLSVDPETDLGVSGTKSMTGRDFKTGDTFTFRISAETAGAPLPGNTDVTINPSSGTEKAFAFVDDITFTKPGQYSYLIQEINPNAETGGSGLAGVSYDGTQYRLIVDVADNGDGTLAQTHELFKGERGAAGITWTHVDDGAIAFENVYHAESVQISFRSQKNLTGKTLEDNSYTFVLSAGGSRIAGSDAEFAEDPDQPMPDSGNAEISNIGKSVAFDNITFTQADIGKEYQYFVREKQPTEDGTYEGAALEGAVKNASGQWVYKGITYDNRVQTITAVVSSEMKDGTETVRVATSGEGYEGTGFSFENEYQTSGEMELRGTKTITGRDFKSGDTFTFTVTAPDGTPMPEKTEVTIKPSSGTSADVDFGKIKYTQAGDYTYTITESDGDLGGIAYDTTAKTVTVHVSDNGDGTLKIDPEYSTGDSLVWNNTYKAVFDTDTAVTINGIKNLTGQSLEAGEFTFNIIANDGAPMGSSMPTNMNRTGSDTDGDGTYTGDITLLNNITYTNAGTYTYLISEQIPAPGRLGMTYDSTVYKVEVIVTDDLNGRLYVSDTFIQKSVDDGGTYENADGIVFNNSYAPLSTDIQSLKLTKKLSGDRNTPLQAGEFSFTISGEAINGSPSDGFILPETRTVSNEADGSVQFGNITFTKAGEYKIQVSEVIPEENDRVAGVEYDSHTVSTIFKVTDQDGQLVATRTSTQGDRTFTNKYNTTGTVDGSAELKVTKDFTGRGDDAWLDGDAFTFNLTAANEETKTAVSSGDVELPENAEGITISSKSSPKTAAFGDIKINKPGTYVFAIAEDAQNPIAGVTYDTTARMVTITAEDNGDGTLDIQVSGNSESDLTFKNVYNPDETFLDGQTALKVTKTFTGRPDNEWLNTDQFTFVLAADTSDKATAEAVKNGEIVLPDDTLVVDNTNNTSAAFGNITFKAAGTYKFTVTETDGGIAGVDYDTEPRTITVQVTDMQNGTMEASVVEEESDELTFNNTYKTTSTDLDGDKNLTVTKNFTGRADDEWLKDDAFTFTLTADPDEEDQTTQKAINEGIVNLPDNASGLTIGADTEGHKAAFGNITFKEPGIYQFVVSEKHAGETIDGITYDDAVKHVIIHVKDNTDGTLTAQLDENSDSLVFKNTYDTQSTTLIGAENLEVTKNFTGRPDNEWLDGDKFSFSIAAKDKTTQDAVNNNIVKMPASSVITVDKAHHTAAFGDITFTEPGTYTFTVKEEPGKISGVAYDKSEKTVTVEVKDNKDGTLTAQIVKAATDELTFSNTYDTTSTELNGETSLTVTKDFTGRENGWLEDDAFTFTLTADPDDQTTVKAVDDKTVLLPDNADGLTITGENKDHQASFGNITFTEPGTYKFVVSEVKGDILGVNYDDAVKHVTVVVSDKNDGTLEAKLDSENSNALTFTNTYTAKDAKLSGEANLKVTKVLEGRDWFEDDSFTFKLETGDELTEKAVDAGDIVLPDTELTISSDTGDHTNAFGDITFKKTGDYTFTVSEVTGDIANVAYDSHKAVVNVHVTDNNEGSLVASVTPTTEGSLTFTNTYSPTPVTAALAGTKVMSGRDLKDTDTFTFTVNKGEGMPEDTPMPAVTTAQNDADGKIVFAPITFKEAGTYEYVITETGGSVPGVTNDSGVVYAEVKVTYDPATGILTPDVTYSKEGGNGGEGFTFTNVYNASPTDTVTGFDAVKTVTPSDGNSYQIQGGEFAFSITPSVNNPDSDPVRAKTVTNDADGNVQLASGVQYTEAGTYSYTVKEETGSVAGMSYDDSVYVITVTVTDDQGTGKLVSSTAVTKDGKPVDGIAFDNGYNPQQTSAVLGGKKNLEGLDLTDGAFTFSLKGVSADTAQEDMAVPMPESGKDTAQNTDAGIFQFGEIVYTVPGTYVYEISEVNQGQEGYTYDKSVYQVTVTVTDEGGQLRAQTAGLDKVVFNNSYKPAAAVLDGDAAIHGQKTLTGRDMKEGEFAFQLLDKDNNVVSETVNSADGSFRFDALTFEEAGDYYYTMVEKNTELGGITYDTTGYTVKVHVEDKGGHLEASVQYLDPEGTEVSVPDFNNQYGAKGTQAILAATKVLEGRKLQAGEFSFVLKDQDGTTLSTAVNDEAGVVQFDAVSYEEAGEYTYTISEVQGDDSTITYDDTVYNVTVTVTDDGNGNLNASVDYNGAEPVFTNTYKEPAAEEPAQPTEPEQPTKPEQPAEPEQPEESENSGNAPTTGDNAMRGPLTAAAVAAAGIIIAGTAVVRRRKKDNC